MRFLLMVPTLRVVTPPSTLRVRFSTRRVCVCMPTQSVGTIKSIAAMCVDGSHAPRGNPALDAPRPGFDAERQGLHAHAERGYDQINRGDVC
jgi:hypothetical protein